MAVSLRQPIIVAAAAAFLLPALACFPAEVKEGERLYVRHCASCHGNGALGTDSAPALHFERRTGATERVKHHHGQMPPFLPSPLSDDEASKIVEYLIYLHHEASGHRH